MVEQISYSGADVEILAYIPLESTRQPVTKSLLNKPSLIKLGTIQTLTLSSARSVSPVRALGRAAPIAYNKGARTFAGTLVFATLSEDPFVPILRSDVRESTALYKDPFFVDQLPEFDITIVASNEIGQIAAQGIFGVTITNFGTSYSIDDLYVETTYTYVARTATPLVKSKRIYSPDVGAVYTTPLDKGAKLSNKNEALKKSALLNQTVL